MKTFKQFLKEDSQTSTSPKAPTPAPQVDDPFEGNAQLKSIYAGFVNAEHTGSKIKDPYAFNPSISVRTRAGGGKSSAYGPVQVTSSTVKVFMKTQPQLFKGIEDFANQFVAQGTKMLKADIKDPKYGLGCTGDLCDEKHHFNSQRLAVAIIKGKAKEKGFDLSKPLSDEQLTTLVGSWRGADEKTDPRYYRAFREGIKMGSAPAQPVGSSQQTTQAPASSSTLQSPPLR